MKKIIGVLVIAILFLVLFSIIIFLFNPFNLRTKIIGGAINAYLGSVIEDYVPLEKNIIDENVDNTKKEAQNLPINKNPLLTEEQEKSLESYGVDVGKLPTEITPGMQECFYEKVGEERGNELISGTSPTPLEIIKIQSCLGK
jgi:hypothetical protein